MHHRTKAWNLDRRGAAIGVVELWRQRVPDRHKPAIAWTVPAIALLVFLQLGFAPANHSVARGSLEVASATARGSLPAGALARVTELAQNFGLATLPLFAFGAVGLRSALRRRSSAREIAVLRFVHIPALVYLARGVRAGSPQARSAAATATCTRRCLRSLCWRPLRSTGTWSVMRVAVGRRSGADRGRLRACIRGLRCGQHWPHRGWPCRKVRARVCSFTDSPVVAFFSHKAPANIAGSQSLPIDRAQAIFLAAHATESLSWCSKTSATTARPLSSPTSHRAGQALHSSRWAIRGTTR